jgi:hypothetical protein
MSDDRNNYRDLADPAEARDELRTKLDVAIFNQHGGGSVSSRWTVDSILDAVMPILAAERERVRQQAYAETIEAAAKFIRGLEDEWLDRSADGVAADLEALAPPAIPQERADGSGIYYAGGNCKVCGGPVSAYSYHNCSKDLAIPQERERPTPDVREVLKKHIVSCHSMGDTYQRLERAGDESFERGRASGLETAIEVIDNARERERLTGEKVLRARFSDLAVELEKHSNDHIRDAMPDNLGAAVEGVCADRINAILKESMG